MAKSNRAQPEYRKNKYAAPIGGIFIVLAAIGLVTVILLCLRFTQGLLDDTGEKEQFEEAILPVVMFDPGPFEDVKDVDPLFLLRSSLWDTLLGDKRSSYQYDDLARLMVPASDVDIHCARLFGPEIKLPHQTFGNVETTYEYREATKMYYIPTSGEVNFYTPSVEHVVKKGDSFMLTVGYLAPLNVFTQIMTDETGERMPEKYMLYELLKVKDHYQIVAVRDLPVEPGRELIPYGLSPTSSQNASNVQTPVESAPAGEDTTDGASSGEGVPEEGASQEEAPDSAEEPSQSGE